MDHIILFAILCVVFGIVILIYHYSLKCSEADVQELRDENARLRTILHV